MSNEPGILPKPVPFGKYYLLERINVGGMAEVYKAKAFGVEGFERLLAVKKILSSIAEDESFINMFIDEAKIAGQLTHPNIAQIFDLGKVDDSYFIAMEYISGKDLKTIFERARRIGEKVDIPRVCYVLMKVCEGLAYAHEKKDSQGNPLNIVHRDISPQNILISYEGEVKVIDFGIAKATGKQSQTQVGILKGKFSYMSPEQVRGLHVDHRSDIFSLGIVLYELLTLERLFLGDSDFDTLEKIRKVEMSPPSLYNPHIPKELEDIVLRALAKSPDDRYQSAHDLAEALERFMRNQGYYFTNKDLANSMKDAFNADIEFENKKLEYYRGLNLQAPTPDGTARVEDPSGSGIGLEWGEEEMETQIFDRPSDEVEAITESQIVYAEEADLGGYDEPVGEGDATIEFNRWDVQNQMDDHQPVDNRQSLDTGPAPELANDGGSRQRHQTAQVSVPAQERRDPQVTVQSASPQSDKKRKPGLIIAAVAAVVIIVGLGVFFATNQGSQPSIAFETQPEQVSIFINGQKIHSGTTPFTHEVPAGQTEIRIESEGYEPYTKSLELEPGNTYSLNQTLQKAAPEKGGLFVKTEPSGAKVVIDGKERDEPTPLTIEELDAGEYTIEVSYDGYFAEEKKVEVGSGVEEVSIALRPKKVALTVRSEPSRSRFAVYEVDTDERVARGRTPETIEALAGDKKYRVVVDKHGYDELEKIFEPGTDKENTLELELEREEDRSSSTSSAAVAKTERPRTNTGGSSSGGSSASQGSKAQADQGSSKEVAQKEDKPEPKKEPVGTGTVNIGSKPSARVYINGKDTGRYTPLLNFKLKAGKYTIRLVNEEEGLDATRYITLKPGASERVIHRAK